MGEEQDMEDDPDPMATFVDMIARAILNAGQAGGAGHSSCPASSSQPNPGVTGLALPSGLEVRHVARSQTQQQHAGVVSKHDRGDNEAARLKRKKIVVVALPQKLQCNNALKIIAGGDIENHDLALDCQQW